jgi:adenosylcobinamide-phosphate synthase
MCHALALAALLIEAAAGYPGALFRRIGHPVTWIGRLISWLDRGWNRETASDAARRVAGVVAVLLLLLVSAGTGLLLQYLLLRLAGSVFGVLAAAMLGSALIAQRSLDAHVRAVANALERDGLAAGRNAVSHIVGRDTAALDESGVSRAAIESQAENFSDGVVAPVFWMAALGLPGALAYKAVNTADSMIGHKTARYLAFGWAAARLDDLVNLPASRLSALWIVLAACVLPGADPRGAMRAISRDAAKHKSPNAGWPEAAMAGALGIRIAGPRVYAGVPTDTAWMGDGRAELSARDIRKALALYRIACVWQALALALLMTVLP